MSTSYLILLRPTVDREDFTKYWDSVRPTDDWFYMMPNSIFITTDLTSRQISELIMKKYGNIDHVVTKVTKDTWGWAVEEYWKRMKPYPGGSST